MVYKIDMHCHTAKGSLDARADIEDIIIGLKNKGFNGVLITDHNSYKGYKYAKQFETEDFKILKGIEYDTCDAGHILIILPENAHCKEFEFRGMTLKMLSKMVHKRGGIMGLAHPFDHGPLGAFRRHINKHRMKYVMSLIDFVEIFNSSASEKGNIAAKEIANQYNKATTAGSDCHRQHSIGLASCLVNTDDLNEDSLIKALKNRQISECRGEYTQRHLVGLKHIWFNFATSVYFFATQPFV